MTSGVVSKSHFGNPDRDSLCFSVSSLNHQRHASLCQLVLTIFFIDYKRATKLNSLFCLNFATTTTT